jgi:hypothetical protein
MNINRHNYENLFLLYVDNELSEAEKRAVDDFILKNADLKEELELLQQTVIKKEAVVFGQKESLLKQEGITALQEKLLLFADNELAPDERKIIEARLETDKFAAAEWNLMKKTIGQPDTNIVFDDKRALYRTSGNRVVGMKWWRAVAAAVILLGLGIWIGVALFSKSPKTNGHVESIAKEKNSRPVENPTNSSVKVNPIPDVSLNNEQGVQPLPQEKTLPTAIIKKAPDFENMNLQKGALKKEELVVTKNDQDLRKPENHLPKPVMENINKLPGNKIETVIVQPKVTNEIRLTNEIKGNDREAVALVKNEKGIDQVKNITDRNLSVTTNSLAQNASLPEEVNDDRILYLSEDKVRKSKVGGLFRKLKNVIDRAKGIKSGDGIKIANFQISLK